MHVVLVVVKNMPHARASALYAAIERGWEGRDPTYDIRSQVLVVPNDKAVAATLVDRVLPDIPRHRPVVVFCSNSCMLLDARLDQWVDRWVRSDRPLWATADEAGAVVWGVFSGVASDLASFLGEPGFRTMRIAHVLTRLQQRNHLLGDAAPLVSVGLTAPATDLVPHGLTRDEFNGITARYVQPAVLRRVSYGLYNAVHEPQGRGTILAVAVMAVLVVVICLLAAAVARAKRGGQL